MLARDVMTRPAVTISASMSAAAAATVLVSHGFTSAPVVDDDGALIGIITEADLLRDRIAPDPRRTDPGRSARSGTPPTTVAGLMTTPVESLTPGADIADAVRIMLDEHIRCLPIVDGFGVVGIITRRDLLRAAFAASDHTVV